MGDFNTEAQRHRGDVAESRDAVGLARRASRVRLGDVCSLSKGQQINGSELSDEFAFPFLNGGIEPSGRWKETNVKAPTVTISEGGNSCGYVNLMLEDFWCGAHCYFLSEFNGDVRYLYHALKSQQKRIMDLRTGVCMPNIKKSSISDFNLSLHDDLPTQHRIAAVLDQICEMKRNAETRLAKLDLLVKSRFVEMFGDPVSNPKDWQVVSLSEVVESIGNGKSFVCESHPRKNCEPAILKLSAVTWGVYKPEENKALKPGSEFLEECEVRADDLLFTRKNTFDLVGMCAYVRETPTKLMLPDLIFRLETNARIDKVFLANLINFTTFRKIIRNLASGSAASMPNISKARLLELKIPLPPLSLQRSFAAFVAEVDKLELTVRQEIEKVDLLYRAKLQEYFG